MAKKPYIPLYVGDWLKDTDCISLEAEGALLKFIFKMWESQTPGSLSFRFSQISILLKKSEEIARKIVQELHENGILDIEFVGENEVKMQSRRMIRENHKSVTNSENGSKGGRPKSEKQKSEKRIKSELKAKVKRNADIDIDIEYDNDIEIKEEKKVEKIENPFSESFATGPWQEWVSYKKQIKDPIKTIVSQNKSLKSLFKKANGDEIRAIAIIDHSIEKGWLGLYEADTGKKIIPIDKHHSQMDAMESLGRKRIQP